MNRLGVAFALRCLSMMQKLQETSNSPDVVVVKVGTSTMFRNEGGREVLDLDTLSMIGVQIRSLMDEGQYVLLVSSGAVTAGMEATGTNTRPRGDEAMPELQRLAAIGWRHVLNAWHEAIGIQNGGLLITKRELDPDAPERDEALRTAHTLLVHGEIPIFNENDAITHGELAKTSFGQNDTLAALIAAQIAGSELFGGTVRLVQLSDVDGVYIDPQNPSTILRNIGLSDISAYEHLAGDTNGTNGKGGMRTKFTAARIALSAGVEMWVANSRAEDAVHEALAGNIGTHFHLD